MSEEQRTSAQNRSMHKFFRLLADSLNDAGLEMRVVLKEDAQIWWTPEAVKTYLWKPIQKAMYQKKSTRDLSKSQEVSKVHEQLMKILGEKFHVENIPLPSRDAVE